MRSEIFAELRQLLDEAPETACHKLLDYLAAVVTRPMSKGRARAGVAAAGAVLVHLQHTDDREPGKRDVQRLMRAVGRVERALASEQRVRTYARRRAPTSPPGRTRPTSPGAARAVGVRAGPLVTRG
jgi:hypothetical protein